MNLDELINKKQEEVSSKIKKDLEMTNKRFDFIRMLIKENYQDIINYANITVSLIPTLDNIYDIANETANLLNNYGIGRTNLELKSTSKTLQDYLPIKLGFFYVDGTDNYGRLEITKKGEEIRKKYFK